MSSEQDNGIVVSHGDGVYYIPEADLAGYRLTDDAANAVSQEVDAEVSGFGMSKPEFDAIEPVRFAFSGPIKPIVLQGYADAAVIVMARK